MNLKNRFISENCRGSCSDHIEVFEEILLTYVSILGVSRMLHEIFFFKYSCAYGTEELDSVFWLNNELLLTLPILHLIVGPSLWMQAEIGNQRISDQ